MSARTPQAARDGWVLLLLAAWSLHYFFRYGGTAYEWPAVDIAPLVARQLDPDFLANDFFANASAEANPRHVFGFLVTTLARGFGGHWYAALFLLRIAAAVFLPALWYLTLMGYVRAWRNGRSERGETPFDAGGSLAAVVVFVGLVQVVRPIVSAWFSIAWWPPFQPQATSATYSLLFALAGNVSLLRDGRTRAWLGVALWAMASLLHPAVSLFAIALHGIATFDRGRWRGAAAALVGGWLLPTVALAIVCRPTVSLSAAEFVRTYVVVRHPSHYWPAQFGTLTARPWWVSFFLVAGLLLAAVPYAAWRRDRRLTALALLLATAYVGCVGLQYLAVVAWPSKLLAMLGPVRFSALGFYAWLLLAALVAADLASLVPKRLPNVAARLVNLRMPRPVALVLLGIATLFVGTTQLDAPFRRVRAKHAGLFAWIAENTSRDAVFATPDDDLTVDIALVAERPVFAGFGFPFREDFFAEYALRDALLFGTPEQRAQLAAGGAANPKQTYYYSLSPRDFARISAERRLDFVVVAAAHAGSFGDTVPAYADDTHRVYAIYPPPAANVPPPTP